MHKKYKQNMKIFSESIDNQPLPEPPAPPLWRYQTLDGIAGLTIITKTYACMIKAYVCITLNHPDARAILARSDCHDYITDYGVRMNWLIRSPYQRVSTLTGWSHAHTHTHTDTRTDNVKIIIFLCWKFPIIHIVISAFWQTTRLVFSSYARVNEY